MTQSTTIVESYILEPGNMSRYNLIFCTYKDPYYKALMCSITWLTTSRGGRTFVWPMGDSIWAGYACEKSDIATVNLAPILLDVRRRFPGSIDRIEGLDGYDENGCWVGVSHAS